MHFINPFKGLRPSKENVSSVVIPSTDHLSKDFVSNHKKNNKWSYANILEPDYENIKLITYDEITLNKLNLGTFCYHSTYFFYQYKFIDTEICYQTFFVLINFRFVKI